MQNRAAHLNLLEPLPTYSVSHLSDYQERHVDLFTPVLVKQVKACDYSIHSVVPARLSMLLELPNRGAVSNRHTYKIFTPSSQGGGSHFQDKEMSKE